MHKRPTLSLMRASTIALIVASLALASCRTRSESPSTTDSESRANPGASPLGEKMLGEKQGAPIHLRHRGSPNSFAKTISETESSLVHLSSSHPVKGGIADDPAVARPATALGTAFVVDREGFLLSNAHLVTTSPKIFAHLGNGEILEAKVIGQDSELDLALLKVEVPPTTLRPARLGNSKELEVGEWLVALGRPSSQETEAHAGMLSSLGPGSISQNFTKGYEDFLQTDMRLGHTTAGGPVIDASGAVVGIATARSYDTDTRGFVLPIHRAQDIVPQLKSDGRVSKTWLGVFVHPLSATLAQERGLRLKEGALVSQVLAKSPAAKAGIAAGDVILQYDDEYIDHRSLAWKASHSSLGKSLTVVVWRKGEEISLSLVPEPMPE